MIEGYTVPKVQDIVRIDGRWAQVVSQGLVLYLDDKSHAYIDWHDYMMHKNHRRRSVGLVRALEPNCLSAVEIDNIYYALGRKKPETKLSVSVFGEFKKDLSRN